MDANEYPSQKMAETAKELSPVYERIVEQDLPNGKFYRKYKMYELENGKRVCEKYDPDRCNKDFGGGWGETPCKGTPTYFCTHFGWSGYSSSTGSAGLSGSSPATKMWCQRHNGTPWRNE